MTYDAGLCNITMVGLVLLENAANAEPFEICQNQYTKMYRSSKAKT